VHGARVAVQPNFTALAEVVHRHLERFAAPSAPPGEQPDVLIRLLWGERLPPAVKVQRIGRSVLVSDHRVRIEPLPGLQVELYAEGLTQPWRVTAAFNQQLTRAALRRLWWGAQARENDLLTFVRYAVHYPIFLWHQLNRNRSVLHAAAVQQDGRATIISGPNGAGKSTLALAFVRLLGHQLLTDNFLLADETVLGYPEECRVDAWSGRLLDLPITSKHKVHGKFRFTAAPYLGPLVAEPGLIVFPSLDLHTRKPLLRSLGASEAEARLNAVHFVTRESPEFSEFALLSAVLFDRAPTGVAPTVHQGMASRYGATRTDYANALALLARA
jgi:hypothetical protein